MAASKLRFHGSGHEVGAPCAAGRPSSRPGSCLPYATIKRPSLDCSLVANRMGYTMFGPVGGDDNSATLEHRILGPWPPPMWLSVHIPWSLRQLVEFRSSAYRHRLLMLPYDRMITRLRLQGGMLSSHAVDRRLLVSRPQGQASPKGEESERSALAPTREHPDGASADCDGRHRRRTLDLALGVRRRSSFQLASTMWPRPILPVGTRACLTHPVL